MNRKRRVMVEVVALKRIRLALSTCLAPGLLWDSAETFPEVKMARAIEELDEAINRERTKVKMKFSENVSFPARHKPLPPGYRVVQLDSGHFLWVKDNASNANGGPIEGLISWDRYWVRRCAFAYAKENA